MEEAELNKMLSEIEQDLKKHPFREKSKIWKWIIYCYLTNNKFINRLKIKHNEKVKSIFCKSKIIYCPDVGKG